MICERNFFVKSDGEMLATFNLQACTNASAIAPVLRDAQIWQGDKLAMLPAHSFWTMMTNMWMWPPLYNGHQTSISYYPVISTKLTYTRIHFFLVDKLKVLCPMVALSSGHLSIKDPILQSHITQSFPLNLTSIPGHFLIMDKLAAL
jgi:hypothetical protein